MCGAPSGCAAAGRGPAVRGAPGSAPRARAPGSVPSLVAPLSLSRPAGLSPRSRHGLQAEATRPRTRLLLLRRRPRGRPAVAPSPGSPGSRQGPCGWGGRPGRPGDSCGLRRESVAAGARAGAPLTRGMGRSGCGFRAGTGRLSWADAGVGSVAPESRPAAHRAPFPSESSRCQGGSAEAAARQPRQHPTIGQEPRTPGRPVPPTEAPPAPRHPGTSAPRHP